MIEFSLKKTYGGRAFSFSSAVSAFPTGIFGRSGAGKSTLLHMLAGLIKPDSGTLRFNGNTLYESSAKLNIPAHRRSIGLVHQDGLLFPGKSTEDNLLYGRKRLRGDAKLKYQDVVDLLELGPVLDQRAELLSGGERQRVALGRAILAEPALLLCDEPFASVDSQLKWKVLSYLNRIINEIEIPILYVSHDIREVTALCGTIMVISDDRIIAHGPYHSIIDQMAVYQAISREQVENTLHCRIVATDWEAGFTRVECSGIEFSIPPLMAETGEQTVLSVGANEIILARERPRRISTRNCLPGTITRITRFGKLILAHVDAGCPLLVELTPSAIQELDLKEGAEVFVLIKANSFIPIQSR